MTAIDRDRARAAFKSYTDAYDATNPRIALKIEHTYHVAEACDAVAREQGWSSEDIDLAWLCGLLHDMGRFEQLRRWDTFKDAESMSHAVLGIEILFGENPADAPAVTSIRDFIDDPAEDELIRASIAYHSDFRLPAQLDERTRSFCDIVRDGDKIDIMRTIADSTVDTILKVDEKTFLGSRFSSPTLAAFDEHRCVARDERNEPADYLVGLICFMFELVYPASRALAREQGNIYRLLDAPFGITRPFTDPATQATWSRLKDEMRDWLARLALKLSQQLLDDLDGIADNLVLGSTKNGGIRVLVDGDNALSPTDAGKMLDGARNTDTHEKLGRNRYARLANLMAILQPAGLHDRSRAAKLGSQSLGEPSHQRQIFLGTNAATHHDQALGIGDRSLLSPLLGGNRDLDTSLSIIRK